MILFAILVVLWYNIVNWGVIAMFGYIKTYKPEMKIREFDAYKAVYCSLCKQLRKDYGFFARFTLNYDYTFLAMIRMAALQSPALVIKGRCPFNPLAKCNNICCDDDSLAYSAAVAMLMVYYKLMDTKADERFFKKTLAWMLQPIARYWRNRAIKKYPDVNKIICSFLEQQTSIEQSDQQGLDCFAHPTAQALSNLFCYNVADDSVRRILEVIGYNVGKWVYLIDALDDFRDDIKLHRFNPYVRRLGDAVTASDVCQFAVRQLNVCMDEACMAFDLLPKKNFSPIIQNILVMGLENVQNEIVRKVKNNE